VRISQGLSGCGNAAVGRGRLGRVMAPLLVRNRETSQRNAAGGQRKRA